MSGVGVKGSARVSSQIGTRKAAAAGVATAANQRHWRGGKKNKTASNLSTWFKVVESRVRRLGQRDCCWGWLWAGWSWKAQDRRHVHGEVHQSYPRRLNCQHSSGGKISATHLGYTYVVLIQKQKTDITEPRQLPQKGFFVKPYRKSNGLAHFAYAPAPRLRDRCSLPPLRASPPGTRCTACGATASTGPSSLPSPPRP